MWTMNKTVRRRICTVQLALRKSQTRQEGVGWELLYSRATQGVKAGYFTPSKYRGITSSRMIHKQLEGLEDVDAKMFEKFTQADAILPINIVQDRKHAREIVDKLYALGPDHFHACDTEVADIDLKVQGPVGNGFVTCLSIFSGPDVNFGNGPYVWVDNLDAAEGTLEYFRDFLEDTKSKKIWHNYSFDRHVIYNHGIDVKGLGGDTMHMARLWNTARTHQGGYSLESLTADLTNRRKKPMKELFGVPKLKQDGSPGKELIMPTVRELQRSSQFRDKWMRYSVYDSEATWFLHKFLRDKLERITWFEEADVNRGTSIRSMYDFYMENIVPFGECLTSIERKGMLVDLDYLAKVQKQAEDDRVKFEQEFLAWASKYCEDAIHMNVFSATQKQQLLFCPCKNSKTGEMLPREREFDIENSEGLIEEGKKKAKKKRKITIVGLGIPPTAYTAGGLPAAGADVLRDLAGHTRTDPPKYGLAYKHFATKEEGAEACRAIEILYDISSINTMINNFILPLQELADSNGRVHGSLNINTDTGRLSSRRPNLQNQPALEKDRYKIRDAFIAPPGCRLIVADYSQLELRLLAQMTKCQGMIDAFKAGGDFHSRTAMSMYDYIAREVEEGTALLEWDNSKGKPPVPLVKDKFASERKNAKILNFSIAYGKTPFGLAKDFGVSRKEAQETLERWYADRQEVKVWQDNAIRTARLFGYTRTMMGRYRMLPDAQLSSRSIASKKARSHAERAAINTPIQGAAADVVMRAMLRIQEHEHLKALGWEMVSQIHDEIILEGPEGSAEEACAIVVSCMEHPFEAPLLVDLEVDAKINTSWYKAK